MSDAESAVLAQNIVRLNYAHLIGITFLYFDHLITLDREISLVWRKRKSLSSYSFLLNRYFAFISGIPVAALPFLTLSLKTCAIYSLFRELALLVAQAIVSLIMVMRVYAIFGRSRRVLWMILGVGFCVVGVAIFSVTGQQASRNLVVGGCHFGLMQSTAFRLAGSWEALFVLDALIFGLTIYNAYTTRRRMLPQTNLHTVVIRDGAMFFGIVALANLANIATYYFSTVMLPGSLAGFANCISVTMISRLILNLHAHANTGILTEHTGPVVQSNIHLTSLDDILMPYPSSVYAAHSHRRNSASSRGIQVG
ncbi:hypothetical protein B0H17DRAFT_1212331 [Mycena rosella]|uniref:DUF6533 domain-containing protein n=1 Tax=Mycena rosella TaxID=1033263 RepID=A0AAD7G6C4_MYCRO|nr:hypothetical protein B0H17DRAFT_1212331 [Mycena rosella]